MSRMTVRPEVSLAAHRRRKSLRSRRIQRLGSLSSMPTYCAQQQRLSVLDMLCCGGVAAGGSAKHMHCLHAH